MYHMFVWWQLFCKSTVHLRDVGPRPPPRIWADRGWCPKFATGLNIIIGCSSKSVWVPRLLFCQNDYPIRGSFWCKDSLITHLLFELQPIMILSSVANFGHHPLAVSVHPSLLNSCYCKNCINWLVPQSLKYPLST